VRGHRNHRIAKPEHEHCHSNADLIVTICRRLIPLMEVDTTPEGMADAEECATEGLLLFGPRHGEANVLMNKLHSILEDMREEARAALGGIQ
jgi:hypothetical protein